MKAARLVVLVVAVAAGGVAALLAGRGEKPPPAAALQAVKMDTVDILVAKRRHRSGRPVSARICNGSSGRRRPQARHFMRRPTSPTRSRSSSGAIARAPFVAGEPIREAKLDQGERLRLHGRHAATGHARDLDRNLAGNRRRRLHPAERPRRRDPLAARPRGREGGRRRSAGQRDDPLQHPRARDRSDARREGRPEGRRSARPRRSN